MPFQMHVVLYQPEIPPNTGNIIRLCANTGATLHLIEPLGFALGDKELRRAGLDYHEYADIRTYRQYAEFIDRIAPNKVFAFTTRGGHGYKKADYESNDALLFGSETRGLPAEILEQLPANRRLRLPMRPNNRSLNLSNAVAIAVYEAWGQHGFSGADVTGASN